MIAYPDTSFLCALYVPQSSSEQAIAWYAKMVGPLNVSALVLFEFRQSIRLQTWLNSKNPSKGFPLRQGQAALRALDDDLTSGALLTISADWAEVISRADKLSSARTPGAGHRSFDILHVATALHLGAKQFLSFDEKQRLLAKSEGLLPRPA